MNARSEAQRVAGPTGKLRDDAGAEIRPSLRVAPERAAWGVEKLDRSPCYAPRFSPAIPPFPAATQAVRNLRRCSRATESAGEGAARGTYLSLVEQARQPFFYVRLGVADTPHGRVELIMLHLCLLLHRMEGLESSAAAEFRRLLQEIFFSDVDRSLREMGVGDVSIGKRVKKLAAAFYGRLARVREALDAPGAGSIGELLRTTVYDGHAVEPAMVSALGTYLFALRASLAAQGDEALLSGHLSFAELPAAA